MEGGRKCTFPSSVDDPRLRIFKELCLTQDFFPTEDKAWDESKVPSSSDNAYHRNPDADPDLFRGTKPRSPKLVLSNQITAVGSVGSVGSVVPNVGQVLRHVSKETG